MTISNPRLAYSTETSYALILLIFTSLLGDHLVSRNHQRHALKAIIDNSTHFIIGGISWLIVCLNTSSLKKYNEFEIFLCAVIAAAIDVDHFISASSLSLKEATSLKRRPFLHCTTLGLIVCVLLFWKFRRLSLIVFVAFFSHHVRDGTRRGLWFGDLLGSTPPIPYLVYILLNCFTPLVVSCLTCGANTEVKFKSTVTEV